MTIGQLLETIKESRELVNDPNVAQVYVRVNGKLHTLVNSRILIEQSIERSLMTTTNPKTKIFERPTLERIIIDLDYI